MAAEDSPAVLVARFLRTNNYNETLDAFLTEAGLPPDAGITFKGAITVEQILDEKRAFDVSQAFEKVNLEDDAHGWTLPAPLHPTRAKSLQEASNLLHVSIESVKAKNTEQDKGEQRNFILATDANRNLNLLAPHPPFNNTPDRRFIHDSPVLSCLLLSQRYLLATTMSGGVILHDLIKNIPIDERRDHQKYVVKAAYAVRNEETYIATAAWDSKVFVYKLHDLEDGEQNVSLGDPVAEVKLPTNPEAVLFVEHPEISTPVLLITRRDSTFLYYYAIPEVPNFRGPETLLFLGRQNLAPHSNAWVAFSPSALALSPQDPSILAVATSAIPHMKLIVVRMLLPPPPRANDSFNADAVQNLTQASQARADLAKQDRETAAMLINCTTMAPQTPYSTPSLTWRPDASGIYVNGDDGAIRGIEVSTGKIVATLKDGHEAGTKIRCLWAGWMDEEQKQEVIISGGFDRRLIVWTTPEK